MYKSFVALAVLLLISLSGCVVHYSIETPSEGTIAVSKQVTLEAGNGEFDSIEISSPRAKPILSLSPSNQVLISGTFYAETPEAIDSYISKNLHRELDGRTLKLSVTAPFYQCELTRINGAVKVHGICLEAIQVSLPETSKTKVFLNGQRIDHSSAMTLDDALRGIRALSFDDDRIKVVRAFAESNSGSGRFVTIADILAILPSFSFDSNKLEVARIFAGHVSDPGHATQVMSSFDFDNNKVEAATLLNR